jgi:hypothetical protein
VFEPSTFKAYSQMRMCLRRLDKTTELISTLTIINLHHTAV